MKKKNWLIALVSIGIITGLWFGKFSIIPREIARISGEIYMDRHFSEMKLHCVGVDCADDSGNYTIVFRDPIDSTYYACLIGPKYFPFSIKEGLTAIEHDYVIKYK